MAIIGLPVALRRGMVRGGRLRIFTVRRAAGLAPMRAMRFHVFVIGKPKLDFARSGVEEYTARLRPYVPVELHYLKAGTQSGESVALLGGRRGCFVSCSMSGGSR